MIKNISLHPDETIAIVSDIHIDNRAFASRIDNMLETCLAKLDDILDKCIARRVRLLILEGDIFDRLNVSHETVNRFGGEMLKFRSNGIDIYSIIGNHDIYRNGLDEFSRSPLQTLFMFGIVKPFDDKLLINGRILITPCHYTQQPSPADRDYPVNMLVAHMFYNKSELIDDGRHNLTDEDIERLGYDYIFLGHDHEEFPPAKTGRTTIYRHGSVIRNSVHKYNFERIPKFLNLASLTSDRPAVETVEIACEPYDKIISQAGLNRKQDNAVFREIASKLVNAEFKDSDDILKTVTEDTTLSDRQKNILLGYINKN